MTISWSAPELVRTAFTSPVTPKYSHISSSSGGGPIAARLALNGFSGKNGRVHQKRDHVLNPAIVLLIDAGKDYVGYNTTVPLFLTRATEDPPIM